MKKLHLVIILFVVSAISSNLIAQNTDVLDKKFGFQKFKFNTSPNHYAQYNLRTVKEGIYSVGNVLNITIGEYDVEKVDLYFKRNNLHKITVELDDKKREKNVEIYNALIENYGRPTSSQSISTFNGTRAQETLWKGKDVNLKYTLKTFRQGDEVHTKIILNYSIIVSKKALRDDL